MRTHTKIHSPKKKTVKNKTKAKTRREREQKIKRENKKIEGPEERQMEKKREGGGWV